MTEQRLAPDVSTGDGPKALDAERLAWFRERARCHDAVHPGALLRHIDVLEIALAQAEKDRDAQAERGNTAYARVSALEQHVSELEKSLANARKERDEAVVNANARFRAMQDAEEREKEQRQRAERSEREASDLEALTWDLVRVGVLMFEGAESRADANARVIARLAAKAERERNEADALATALREARDAQRLRAEMAEAELARLKPTGQVAEDVATVRTALQILEKRTGLSYQNAGDALHRLAATAQAHAEAVAVAHDTQAAGGASLSEDEALVRERFDFYHQKAQAALLAFRRIMEKAYDAAVANNTALLDRVGRLERALRRVGGMAEEVSPDTMAGAMQAIVTGALDSGAPDPILERMKRLEEALKFIQTWELPRVPDRDDPARTVSYGYAYGSNGERDFMRDVANKALVDRWCTDASCKACRSGEPCH